LNTCAVSHKARKAFEANGNEVVLQDVRAEPLSEEELAELIAEFGDWLVDRQSNDQRALNDWLQNSEAEAQISAQPKVMTRPIIRHQNLLHLGWEVVSEKALRRDARLLSAIANEIFSREGRRAVIRCGRESIPRHARKRTFRHGA